MVANIKSTRLMSAIVARKMSATKHTSYYVAKRMDVHDR